MGNKSEKHKYCVIPYPWKLKKKGKLIDAENRFVVERWRRGRGLG